MSISRSQSATSSSCKSFTCTMPAQLTMIERPPNYGMVCSIEVCICFFTRDVAFDEERGLSALHANLLGNGFTLGRLHVDQRDSGAFPGK